MSRVGVSFFESMVETHDFCDRSKSMYVFLIKKSVWGCFSPPRPPPPNQSSVLSFFELFFLIIIFCGILPLLFGIPCWKPRMSSEFFSIHPAFVHSLYDSMELLLSCWPLLLIFFARRSFL